MAVEIWQGDDYDESVSVDDATVRTLWHANGSENEAEVRAAAGAAIPLTFGMLLLQQYTLTHRGAGFWDLIPEYGPLPPLEPATAIAPPPDGSADPAAPPGGTPPGMNDRTLEGPFDGAGWRFNFTGTGGSQRIYKALETERFPSTAPDTGGAIGATEDSVEGVDAAVRAFSFTARKRFSVGTLPPDFGDRIYFFFSHVNDTTVKIQHKGLKFVFKQEELKFDGGTIEEPADNALEVVLNFSCERQVTFDVQLYTPGTTPGTWSYETETITKKGWRHVEYKFINVKVGDIMTRVPRFVYVHRVFHSKDLRYLFC